MNRFASEFMSKDITEGSNSEDDDLSDDGASVRISAGMKLQLEKIQRTMEIKSGRLPGLGKILEKLLIPVIDGAIERALAEQRERDKKQEKASRAKKG